MSETTATRQVRVSRARGVCDRCGAEGHVIRAYDPQAYEGLACPDCVISGRASSHPVDGGIMRPMVWVARGLLGEQPFARLLRAAERQRDRERKRAVKKKRNRTRHPRSRKKRKT